MLTNIVILLFSSLVATILFKFGLKAVKGFDGFIKRLLPAFAVILLFLLINLGMAFLANSALQRVIAMRPTTSIVSLQELPNNRPVIFTGTVSHENSLVTKGRQEYVAYVAKEDIWKPLNLMIEAQGKTVSIDNDSYRQRNWPRDLNQPRADQVLYLNRNQPVVIMGRTVVTNPVGASQGQKNHRIRAELIYAGSHEQFIINTQRRLWGPRIMAGLNAFAIGAIGLGVLMNGFKRWRRRVA